MQVENLHPYDICVIGGGYMGAAVGLGLARAGAKAVILDKISMHQRASKANFGLVWSQSKGANNRPYARLSESAVRMFETFNSQIEAETGIQTELRLGKGLIICLGEEEFEAKTQLIHQMHQAAQADGEQHPSRMLDRKEVQDLVKGVTLGQRVMGASFSSIDGDVNPLGLLKAMRKSFLGNRGRFCHGVTVHAIKKMGQVYRLVTSQGTIEAPKIVLAAGLGNMALAQMLGTSLPLIPQKGQLLVTERVKPFLSFPCSGLRQTGNGSIMIGYTNENTGFDVTTTVREGATLAGRALATFPGLSRISVVRSWAGLRVLTDDGAPIYDEIDENAWAFATHSCITLAPVHERLLTPWILQGKKTVALNPFSLERFNV